MFSSKSSSALIDLRTEVVVALFLDGGAVCPTTLAGRLRSLPVEFLSLLPRTERVEAVRVAFCRSAIVGLAAALRGFFISRSLPPLLISESAGRLREMAFSLLMTALVAFFFAARGFLRVEIEASVAPPASLALARVRRVVPTSSFSLVTVLRTVRACN